MSARITSAELATSIARQYPTGGWISAKQARFLVDLYLAEVRESIRRDNTGRSSYVENNKANGNLYEGDTLVASWSVVISPRNGCGNFIITPFVDPRPAMQEELTMLETAIGLYQQMGLPEELYSVHATRLARLKLELAVAA